MTAGTTGTSRTAAEGSASPVIRPGGPDRHSGGHVHLNRTLTRTLVVLTGIALAVPGVVTPRPATAYAAPADAPGLQTVALAQVSGAAAATASGTVAPRTTQPFSLIGATWTDPAAKPPGTIRVRTRSAVTGAWSAWRTLDADEPDAAEPGTEPDGRRGGTDPVWVGDSDGVAAQVITAPGRTGTLPDGMRLDLINPAAPEPAAAGGATGPGVTAAPRAATQAAPSARAASRARPLPPMVTRAGWGADESIVKGEPQYTSDVKVIFVHHTAGSNNYGCAQSAAIIRGIQRYHVHSKGWNDIGYNFLVDKCGTLFEGRGGGADQPVLGAHTLGFNSHSAAIAVIGDYTSIGAPASVRAMIARVAAWKLGTYGTTAAGTVTLVSSGSDRYAEGHAAVLNRISGHRDTGYTACPGTTLYGQLGSIRSLAAAAPAGLRLSRIGGAAKGSSAYYTRGTIAPHWTIGTSTTMLWRFDVLVDGRLATSTPAAHRTTTLRLTPGRHTITVRAVGLNGISRSFARVVVADTTAPEFTAGPVAALATGSLQSRVPVRLGWRAADAGELASQALIEPDGVRLSGTATRLATTMPAGHATTFTLRANDEAGNAGFGSVTRTASVAAESDAARTGSWRTLRSTAFLAGQAFHSTTRNSTLTWRFTGRAAALAVSRTGVSGRVKMYVDGSYVGVVDLRARGVQNRRSAWVTYWGSSGRHTVRVAVEGSAGRPGVVIDGLVILR
ncbi:peptidoglycan recognition protein family protein [Mangrovihabitans endophyticus]|uniref:peptidoglycan recognition protein family protein n=1 Tax=Mangrovihabitans endophyticus TaxID=1751298 RepID=UPI001E300FA5|nr:peptidoglycan recognition protein [Mangrovihabitans endophyticus]